MDPKIALAAAFVATLSGGAFAATASCDFSSGADVHVVSSIAVACDPSLSVTVRGGVYEGGGTGSASNFDESGWIPAISRYSGSGLGVYSGDEEHTIDNYRGDEYVRFVFSAPVRVTSVTLTRIGDDLSGADADISYRVGSLGGAWGSLTVSGLSELATYTHTLPTLAFSDTFRLGALFGDSNDDFKIRSMTVETHGSVPAPGTLALVASALGLAGLVRRRGRRTD